MCTLFDLHTSRIPESGEFYKGRKRDNLRTLRRKSVYDVGLLMASY
jgi:hypothetical protein